MHRYWGNPGHKVSPACPALGLPYISLTGLARRGAPSPRANAAHAQAPSLRFALLSSVAYNWPSGRSP